MKKEFIINIIIILLLSCQMINTNNETKTEKDEDIKKESTNLLKLTTNGSNIIIAESGNTINLKGIAFTGGVWSHTSNKIDDYKYFTTEWDFQDIKKWGANAVTFYMNYNWFQNKDGYTYFEEILNYARKYDIYIIPQITVYPEGGHRGGPDFFNSTKAMEDLKEFWINFAERYKDREEIAGYSILDEPHSGQYSVGNIQFKIKLRNYMVSVIDGIRKVDYVTPIYIQSIYGNPRGFVDIPAEKTHIVYNIHFYEPLGYTSAGYSWISNGGVPLDMSYPGEYYERIYNDQVNYSMNIHLPVVESGTADWKTYEVDAIVPDDGTNLLYLNLFCDGDRNAVIYYDDIEYEIDGTGFKKLPYGSFEESSDMYLDEPLVWIKYNANGIAERTSQESYEGKYSIKLSNCTGWVHYENIDYWISSAGAVKVSAGQNIKIKFKVKTQNASADKNGIQLKWAIGYTDYLDKANLLSMIDEYIINRKNHDGVRRPVFIGEFSPSLASNRPGCLLYLSDMLEYFNENNINWTYYVYRETRTDPDKLLLGIYNGPSGAETKDCPFIDTEILNIVKQFY